MSDMEWESAAKAETESAAVAARTMSAGELLLRWRERILRSETSRFEPLNLLNMETGKMPVLRFMERLFEWIMFG